MARPLSSIVALTLAVSAACPEAAEVVHHPGYTMAGDDRGEMLVWVSEEVLNAPEPPEGFPAEWWPAVEKDRAGLAQHLAERSADTACLLLDQGEPVFLTPRDKTSASPTDYATFLTASELVVLAEVRSVEPGITVIGSGQIAQRVRVSVEEVLRDTGGSISPGDELTYLERGGNLRFGKGIACLLETPEREVPEPGTQVILSDSIPRPASSTFIHPSTVFPVRDSTVVLPAGTRFTDRELRLEEVRDAVSLDRAEATK